MSREEERELCVMRQLFRFVELRSLSQFLEGDNVRGVFAETSVDCEAIVEVIWRL